jgi:hypothetical protein
LALLDAEDVVVDEPPTAVAASLRAAAAFAASTALFALAVALSSPATPGAVETTGASLAGLGRSTRNHATRKTSATIRRMRKGRLILSTSLRVGSRGRLLSVD